jgi:hypothetical protein
VTLVGQRVFGIALGYEDLNDHDELRHDPMLAVLSGMRTIGAELYGAVNDAKGHELPRRPSTRRGS